MKIVIVGFPGSGKTSVAKFISRFLEIPHIESSLYFSEGLDVRERVAEEIKKEHWILEGHLFDVSDLVLPAADKIIVIEDLRIKSLIRSIFKNWMNPKHILEHLQGYEKTAKLHQELVDKILEERTHDVLFLEHYFSLDEGKLADFCEDLKKLHS